jgi:hypothetical protein
MFVDVFVMNLEYADRALQISLVKEFINPKSGRGKGFRREEIHRESRKMITGIGASTTRLSNFPAELPPIIFNPNTPEQLSSLKRSYP